MKKIIIFLCLFVLVACQAHADTIYFKDGTSMKGMVIADYIDRVVFSTVDGEKTLMKQDIKKVGYDDSKMNLVDLGDSAFEKERYKLAHKYYRLALEINPDLDVIRKKADQAWIFVHKEKEVDQRRMIDKKNMLESRGEIVFDNPSPEELLKKELGVALARTKEGDFKVTVMSIKSPFRKARFKIGDRIVSVWSRLTDYLTLEDVSDFLLAQDQHVIRMALSREIKVQKKEGSPLDVQFEMQWEGMVVKSVAPGSAYDKAGLEEGDLLVSVNGDSIRYMKMKDVLNLLNRLKRVKLTIQRSVTIFKSG